MTRMPAAGFRQCAAGAVATILALVLVGCGGKDEPIQAAAAEAAAAAGAPQAVAKAATRLTVTPAQPNVPFGSAAAVHLTLTADGAPAAGFPMSVSAAGVTVAATTGADGAANVEISALPAGPQTITANYAGGERALPATASAAITVDPAATSLILTLTPLPTGATTAAAALTSTTGIPVTGSVTFGLDGALLASAPVATNAAAVEIGPGIGIGDHRVTATFTPDNPGQLNAAEASSTLSITKVPVALIVSGKESVRYGDWTTVDVTVQAAGGDLTGRVALSDANGVVVAEGTTNPTGRAILEFLVAADPGPTSYAVSYAGTGAVEGAHAQLVQQTTQTNVDLVIDRPDTVKPGEAPTISLSVVGTPDKPTGAASIAVDGTEIAAGQLSDGSLTGTARALPAGEHTISVSYGGDTRFQPHQVAASLTVAEPPANPNAAGAAGLQANNPCPPAADACIDLSNELTWLQSGGTITYGPVPITSGMAGYRTPAGTFSVFYKDRDHRSSLFNDAPMPNSVFFNGGIAFHAGSLYDQSHGCIHLSYAASEVFFSTLALGDAVVVWGAAPY